MAYYHHDFSPTCVCLHFIINKMRIIAIFLLSRVVENIHWIHGVDALKTNSLESCIIAVIISIFCTCCAFSWLPPLRKNPKETHHLRNLHSPRITVLVSLSGPANALAAGALQACDHQACCCAQWTGPTYPCVSSAASLQSSHWPLSTLKNVSILSHCL